MATDTTARRLRIRNLLTARLRLRSLLTATAIALLLAALPVAVWLDLTNLADTNLRRQASDLNSVISSVRGYYGTNVVGRVLANPGATQVIHNYESVRGAIPIPATLSLELGHVISEQQQNIQYRFVSDVPFANRTPHVLDDFEKNALASLRKNSDQRLVETSWSLTHEGVRLVAPVLMGAACVSCHNSHPESQKRDWKVGDVRGIQEISITQPIAANLFSFKFLLAYFALATICGISFLTLQQRQGRLIRRMNQELESNNDFLASLSMKISRYISPQVYKSIFSGQKDVAIHTERKKLTIFFSDIQNFTATTERLQPEQVTLLLNEYFTEMSAIALKYGGTIDKFIGDAMLIFFGDPETKGEVGDAEACLRMAWEMQHRLRELNIAWHNSGVEEPFQARMGINSGFCNVGNFGSTDRMDYTIIGAEANLAARLQSVAEPGRIVLSYETYALVRQLITARPLAPITMKGISRDVVPYAVERLHGAEDLDADIVSAETSGLSLYLDPGAIEAGEVEKVKETLGRALAALEHVQTKPA